MAEPAAAGLRTGSAPTQTPRERTEVDREVTLCGSRLVSGPLEIGFITKRGAGAPIYRPMPSPNPCDPPETLTSAPLWSPIPVVLAKPEPLLTSTCGGLAVVACLAGMLAVARPVGADRFVRWPKIDRGPGCSFNRHAARNRPTSIKFGRLRVGSGRLDLARHDFGQFRASLPFVCPVTVNFGKMLPKSATHRGNTLIMRSGTSTLIHKQSLPTRRSVVTNSARLRHFVPCSPRLIVVRLRLREYPRAAQPFRAACSIVGRAIRWRSAAAR